MPEGKIKKVVLEKGYGFISPADGGPDVFFHHRGVVGTPIEDLHLNDTVSYDLVDGPEGKGPRAVNVTRA